MIKAFLFPDSSRKNVQDAAVVDDDDVLIVKTFETHPGDSRFLSALYKVSSHLLFALF